MSTYLDLFIRDILGDSNSLPRQGGKTQSPDIISSGTAAAEDPATQYGADSYDQSLGEDIVYGQDNYLYVRGKNYGTALSVGTISIYAAYRTQLSTPSLWKQLTTATDGTNASAAAAESGVAVTTDPFIWTPAPPATGNPYVLIAVIATTSHPDPVAAFAKHPGVFATWQAMQGGVSALAISPPPPPPPPKPSYTLSASVNVDNSGPLQASIGIYWQNGVVGDLVSVVSDTAGTTGAIGFENFVISQADGSASASGLIPANYASVVHCIYKAQSLASPPTPILTLTVNTSPAPSGGGTQELGPPPPVTQTEIASFQFTPKLRSQPT